MTAIMLAAFFALFCWTDTLTLLRKLHSFSAPAERVLLFLSENIILYCLFLTFILIGISMSITSFVWKTWNGKGKTGSWSRLAGTILDGDMWKMGLTKESGAWVG
jgi:hypothetical protein